MGSMMMSTFLMFIPQNVTFFFLILCCVGFFGIFLPWQERKKKKAVQKKAPVSPVKRKTSPPSSHQLEQLETLKKAGVLTQEEYEEKRKEL